MVSLGIIAAGNGIRLKAEGIKTSKPMVEVNGVPLIKRIIDIAVSNGIKSVSCIINERSNDLKAFLKKNDFPVSVNLIIKSTESSLHSLYELIKKASYPFLLTTSDSVFLEREFITFIDYAMNKREAEGVFAVTEYIDDEKPLYVSVDDKSRILNFYDKNDGFKYVSGGMYLFKKSIRREVEEAVTEGLVRLRNFQRFLIQNEFRLYAYPFTKIIDVDHVSDIEKAENFIMKSMGVE